jgi:hypothetical protein
MVKDQEKASRELQGWQEIAKFLGLPVATAQSWEKSGMPVHRGGRYVYALPDELNRWIGKESPSRAPVHIATENEDLAGGPPWNRIQSRSSWHVIHPSCPSKSASNHFLPGMRFVSCATIPKDTIGTWSLLSSLIVLQDPQTGFDESSARDAMLISVALWNMLWSNRQMRSSPSINR